MRIIFKLQGVEREINASMHGGYTSIYPDKSGSIGHYSNLGNAILGHIKHANIPEGKDHEEIIELKAFIDRFEKLVNETIGLKQEDVYSTCTFIKLDKKVLTKEEVKERFRVKEPIKAIDYKPEVEDDLDLL